MVEKTAISDEELVQILKQCWCSVFDVEDVGLEDSFLDQGGDSLNVVELSMQIEEKLNIAFSYAELVEMDTFDDLVKVVRSVVPKK